MSVGLDYGFRQVLVTPIPAVPRPDSSGFFMRAPWGDAPIRKDGGPSGIGLRTSPRHAFASMARSLDTRSTP